MEVDKEVKHEELSLEEKIQELMVQNDNHYVTIIDYDIKGDYIFVVFQSLNVRMLSAAILKHTQSGLEWVLGENIQSQTTILADKGSPVVTIIRPEKSMKEIKVFDEPAKQVTYFDEAIEGVSLEVSYWIAFSDKVPNHEGDIEIIKE
ncbi:hypothetical protein [Ornithinibacillus salinisoli]